MNKIIKLFIVLLTVCLIGACGGGSLTEKTITVSNVSILGEANKYIQVVDGDYILKPIDDKVTIAVKFKLVKTYDGSKGYSLDDVELIPLDNSGVAISDIGDVTIHPADMKEWSKFNNLLESEVGSTVMVYFESRHSVQDQEPQKKIMKKTTNFKIGADFDDYRRYVPEDDDND